MYNLQFVTGGKKCEGFVEFVKFVVFYNFRKLNNLIVKLLLFRCSVSFGKLLRMVMASAIAALPLEQRDVNVTGGDVSHVAVANVVQASERWIVQAGDCVCC